VASQIDRIKMLGGIFLTGLSFVVNRRSMIMAITGVKIIFVKYRKLAKWIFLSMGDRVFSYTQRLISRHNFNRRLLFKVSKKWLRLISGLPESDSF